MCLADIEVAILCGGLGTRLGMDIPKALVPVRGRPVLEHILDYLKAAGAQRVTLLTGYRAEDMVVYMAGREPDALQFTLSHGEPEGVDAAILRALDDATSDRVLVVNGDTLLTADLCRFVRASAIWPAAEMWTRNAETTFLDRTGYRIFKRAEISYLYPMALIHPITMPGEFLDIGTPERLARAQAA